MNIKDEYFLKRRQKGINQDEISKILFVGSSTCGTVPNRSYRGMRKVLQECPKII
ncbi:hypothetical protein [Robertmurraya sp. Marseille-Q9965]